MGQNKKRIVITLLVAIIAVISVFNSSQAIYAGAKNNLKQVKKYISEQEETRIMDSLNNIDYGVSYKEYEDILSFGLISYLDESKTDYDRMLRLDATPNMKGKSSLLIVTFDEKGDFLFGQVEFKLNKIKSGKNLKFEITDLAGNDYSSEKALQKQFQGYFDESMGLWNKCLIDNTGNSFKTLGVKKYKM